VWCSIIFNKLTGPHIFEGSLTGWTYLNILLNELPLLLEDVPFVTWLCTYLQHDVAPPHFSRQVTDTLHNTYLGLWIGRGRPITWPPRSPDLNPFNFHLWGLGWRWTTTHRVLNAAERIQNTPDVLERTINSLPQQARQCIAADGAQFGHFL
jgi:hypothetical protein